VIKLNALEKQKTNPREEYRSAETFVELLPIHTGKLQWHLLHSLRLTLVFTLVSLTLISLFICIRLSMYVIKYHKP